MFTEILLGLRRSVTQNMQKLELTWIGKGNEPIVEPRILLRDAKYDYGDPNSKNMLIHGDNLLALKALEQEFANRVKCIYIDPPYNTGAAFEQYDDNREHSVWLSFMAPRLRILRNLLSDDGSIWISIDDDEGHYLKVLCDEIFGRRNFVNTVIWEKRYSPTNDSKWLSDSHDFILVYAKNKEGWRPNLLPRGEKQNKYYRYDDDDGRGSWRSGDVLVKTFSHSGVFAITNPNTGVDYYPPAGSCYRFNKETAERYLAENRFYFGKEGDGAPQLKRYLSEVKQGVTPQTLWKRDDVSDNQDAKKEVKLFNSQSIFATPKPERLVERIITLGSNPGDLVLDSFLGSGTTAAVAHKMGRRYIGIEYGEHCYTHCVPRLKAVVDGEQGGISKSVGWTGGGGFKFYELAPTLIELDARGNQVISEQYNPEMLAYAVAKLNGFIYAPDSECFWKQGKGYGSSYIYVTTQYITASEISEIERDMSEFDTLLVCAPAFDLGLSKRYPKITLKKIPQSVLDKCEYGALDYNLNVLDLSFLDDSCNMQEETDE